MAIRVSGGDLRDGGMGEVVVVVVGDDDCVYIWDVFDLTRGLCVPFWAQPGERGAAIFKDGIEEDTQAAGELDIVACVA